MISIHQVADFFLVCEKAHRGMPVSVSKVQTLSYYAEAWHLAMFNIPLAYEPFLAGPRGPFSSRLNYRFNSAFDGFIENPRLSGCNLTGYPVSYLSEIWAKYGRCNYRDLQHSITDDLPWVEARGNLLYSDSVCNPISPDSLRSYYRQLLVRTPPSLDSY